MECGQPLFAICPKPVFIVGAPRSGTSLFRQALGRHPQLWTSAAGDYLQPLFNALVEAWRQGNRYGRYQWLAAQGVSEDEFWRYAGLGFNALFSSRAGSRVWVEKTPDYSRYLVPLSLLFPGARFIHIHRDGRQAVSSMKQHWGWSHRRACHLWQNCTSAVLQFRENQPHRILTLAFEQLMQQSDAAFELIFRFLKLEPHAGCARYIDKQGSSGADDPPLTNSGLMDQPATRISWNWMQKQWFEHTCGSLQGKLGYR